MPYIKNIRKREEKLMQVISSEIGFALKFESKEEISNIIDHLKGQLEWIYQENVEPPYIYLTYNDAIDPEVAHEYINKLKKGDS
jgi:hypothetical protein